METTFIDVVDDYVDAFIDIIGAHLKACMIEKSKNGDDSNEYDLTLKFDDIIQKLHIPACSAFRNYREFISDIVTPAFEFYEERGFKGICDPTLKYDNDTKATYLIFRFTKCDDLESILTNTTEIKKESEVKNMQYDLDEILERPVFKNIHYPLEIKQYAIDVFLSKYFEQYKEALSKNQGQLNRKFMRPFMRDMCDKFTEFAIANFHSATFDTLWGYIKKVPEVNAVRPHRNNSIVGNSTIGVGSSENESINTSVTSLPEKEIVQETSIEDDVADIASNVEQIVEQAKSIEDKQCKIENVYRHYNIKVEVEYKLTLFKSHKINANIDVVAISIEDAWLKATDIINHFKGNANSVSIMPDTVIISAGEILG